MDKKVKALVEKMLPRVCDVLTKEQVLKMARESFEPIVYEFVEQIICLLYGPSWVDGEDA